MLFIMVVIITIILILIAIIITITIIIVIILASFASSPCTVALPHCGGGWVVFLAFLQFF